MLSSSPQPYRSQTLQCPRCRSSGLGTEVIGHCTSCAGSWVAEDVLQERVGVMQHRVPPHLRWHVVERAALPCVACGSAMETLSLFDIPVDRCRGHGIWFDADELATVLLRSQKPLAPEKPASSQTSSSPGSVAADAIDVAAIAAHMPVDVATGVATEVAVETVAGMSGAAIETIAGGATEVGIEAGIEAAGGVLEVILDGLASIFL